MPPAHEPLTFFISYAREDAEFVLRLARDLRAMEVRLWLDQLDIRAGERWDLAIEQALASSQGMIAALSPEAIASTNVMDEISYALEERKLLVPVVVKACAIPFRLRRVQRIDFSGDYQTALQHLHAAVGPPPANADGAASPKLTGAELRTAKPVQGAAPMAAAKVDRPQERGSSGSGWQEDLVEFDETFLASEQPKSQVLVRHMLQVLREKGWGDASVARIEFCLNEIGDNAFSHGIANLAAGTVRIRAFLTGAQCDFRISDTGPGFELIAQVPPQTIVNGEELAAGGLAQVMRLGNLKQVDRTTLELHFDNLREESGIGCQIRKVGDVHVVKPFGRLDHAAAASFQQDLSSIARKKGARIAIDLQEVEYISSAAMRVLMLLSKTVVKENAGRVLLCSATPVVLEILRVCRFDQVFPMVDALEEALARLHEPAA